MNLLGLKTRQKVFHWQPNGDIKKGVKEVRAQCQTVYDAAAIESWLFINKLQIRIKGKKGTVLLIDPRSSVPLDPFKRLTDEEKKLLSRPSSNGHGGNGRDEKRQYNLLENMAEVACTQEIAKVENEITRDRLAASLQFSVTIFAIGCGLAILLKLTGVY